MQLTRLQLIVILLIIVIVYLFWRLQRLEKLVRGYKFKNQEGVGAWTKSKNHFFLLLAGFNSLFFLSDWLAGGFQPSDIISALSMVGLPLYFYFFFDDGMD